MLMSLRAAAQEAGYSYETVWKHFKKGEIPAQKIGSSYAVEVEVLKAIMEARGVKRRNRSKSQTDQQSDTSSESDA